MVEHIALWLVPRKCTLINNFLDSLNANKINNNCMNRLVRVEVADWRAKFDGLTRNIIFNIDNSYKNDIESLVRFVRNMTLHYFVELKHASFSEPS